MSAFLATHTRQERGGRIRKKNRRGGRKRKEKTFFLLFQMEDCYNNRGKREFVCLSCK